MCKALILVSKSQLYDLLLSIFLFIYQANIIIKNNVNVIVTILIMRFGYCSDLYNVKYDDIILYLL